MDYLFENLIRDQFNEVLERYTELLLVFNKGSFFIRGSLLFSAEYAREPIKECFEIELKIPDEYPKDHPKPRETGGRISKGFHINEDGTLCLCTKLGIRLKFFENPTILRFVEDQVIPFLYSFSYFEEFGKMPSGEYSHEKKGIYQFYKDLFKVSEDMSVLEFVKILGLDEYRGHLPCPCKSGKRLRQCHGSQILSLKKFQSIDDFFSDFSQVVFYLEEESIKKGKFLDKALAEKALKRFNKINKKEKASEQKK